MELYHVGKKKGKELSRYQVELNEAHDLAKNGLLSLSITIGLKVLNAMMTEEVEVKAGKKDKHRNFSVVSFSFGRREAPVSFFQREKKNCPV